ncbi:3-oxoacyl-ACP synthase, partial [Exiguobacterium artemiae]|nr:3-oxoacyl-ACP synthase [Exiguobacterium artemiae]
MNIGIVGLGTSLPEHRMTNDDLAATLDTSDEWIRSR